MRGVLSHRPWSSVLVEMGRPDQCPQFLLGEGDAVSWFPILFLLHYPVPSSLPPRTCWCDLLPQVVCSEQRQAIKRKLDSLVRPTL